MAANFKILIHRNSDSIHLKLVGDFDGSAARELINVIKKYSNKFGRIFIHTSGLKEVLEFGRSIFRSTFTANFGSADNLIFTGILGAQLAPAGCRTIYD